MLRLYLLLFIFFVAMTGSAQKQTSLHIATAPRNHLPGFPNFHFTVNGNAYKLKAGECMDMKVVTDSIHIIVEDKRWVKKETPEVHVPAAGDDVYVWVRVTWTGNYRNPQYGAEIVCKSCFEEIKKQCRKTFSE